MIVGAIISLARRPIMAKEKKTDRELILHTEERIRNIFHAYYGRNPTINHLLEELRRRGIQFTVYFGLAIEAPAVMTKEDIDFLKSVRIGVDEEEKGGSP